MRISLKHRCEYLLLLIMAAVVRSLPRVAALGLGRMLGRWSMTCLPGRVRLAEDNMRRALPELGEADIRDRVRKSFEHVGISGVEMLRLDKFPRHRKDFGDYFLVEDLQPLEDALALKRGVIILTGHLGFWEGGCCFFPLLDIPFDVVAKPLKNPLTDAYFERLRKAYGARVLDSRKGARRILQSLREGRTVAVLLDQHISPPGSVVTEFFGRGAYTTTAITSMVMKYQIPVVPIFCLRQPDHRYRIWAEPMLLLSGHDAAAVVDNTQLLTGVIEKAVRRDVSQWFWMHKRWRVDS